MIFLGLFIIVSTGLVLVWQGGGVLRRWGWHSLLTEFWVPLAFNVAGVLIGIAVLIAGLTS